MMPKKFIEVMTPGEKWHYDVYTDVVRIMREKVAEQCKIKDIANRLGPKYLGIDGTEELLFYTHQTFMDAQARLVGALVSLTNYLARVMPVLKKRLEAQNAKTKA